MHIGCRLLYLSVGFLLFISGVSAAQAQYFGRNKVQYDDFNFHVLRTDHYNIYFYPQEERATRDAARMAERWYERHARTFNHVYAEKKPVIFYANTADFQQTNIIRGQISQAIGGVTEPLQERVVMPFTGSYGENNHVLGHELVHSFQYDIALHPPDSVSFSLGRLPSWLIEGMAAYLSLGRMDPHTAMWMRDAAMREDLPTIEELASGRYFPYRYGQAYLAYIGGCWGDETVANLFKLGGRVGLDSAIVRLTGLTPDSLSSLWIDAIKDTYLPLMQERVHPDSAGVGLVLEEEDEGQMALAPVISPNGKYVAFLSRRDVFTMDVYIASTETGEIIGKAGDIAANPHLTAIRFISSAGAWSPDSKKLAFITFAEGDNAIAIWNRDTEEIERTIEPEEVTSMKHLAWSPDGETIAFSGMTGGISDLYLLDLETGQVKQLTDDRYADLQPAWSPNGELLAFTTDRGRTTSFETLTFAPMGLGLIDVESGAIEVIRPFNRDNAIHHNPEFAPGGNSLYFISNQDGFNDIYRYDLTSGQTYRVTYLKTGVSGITGLSPAMSVARETGKMVFTVYSNNNYTMHWLPAGQAGGEPMNPEIGLAAAGILPPVDVVGETLVSNYLHHPEAGLPPPGIDYPVSNFEPDLSLTNIIPPRAGISVGGAFGTQVTGGIGFLFSGLFSEHRLLFQVQVRGSLQDIGGQIAYLNRDNRFIYGVSAAHIPRVFGRPFVRRVQSPSGVPLRQINRLIQRIFIDQVSLNGAYPFSQTRRFEISAGLTRYGFDFSRERYLIGPGGRILRRDEQDLGRLEPEPFFMAQGNAAYVVDYSFFGFTSPMKGARYRLGLTPHVGGTFGSPIDRTYVTALIDYRRYFFLNPITFAVHGLHIGNYGASPQDPFATEYLGLSYYPGFVRGYGFRSFNTSDCRNGTMDGCPSIGRLSGTRMAMASVELRIPLFGTERFGLISFRYLPTQLTFFADAGMAWTANEFPELTFDRTSSGRIPVFSAGVATRFNILGSLILELYYAYPFQRAGPDFQFHDFVFGFQLSPGW